MYGECPNTYNVQEVGLGKAMAKYGHEFIIVYWVGAKEQKCGKEIEVQQGVKKVYLPYKWRIGRHVMPRLELLEKYHFDLLHLQCDNLMAVPKAVDYCLERNLPHYCYVGTLHSSSPKWFVRYIVDNMSIRNFATFRKTKVFGKTPAVVAELQKHGVRSAEFAPVGLDTDVIPEEHCGKIEIKQDLDIPLDKKLVFCVCAMRPDKHPLDLLDLAEKLTDDYYIVHVGADGIAKHDYMKRLAKETDLQKVHYLGNIANEKVHAYYEVADYVVNFNPGEIFGMAILEAMYHDCTVVARRAPGPSCIIEDKKNGYLCDTVGQMADMILSGQKAKEAKKRIEQHFLWASTARKFLENYYE